MKAFSLKTPTVKLSAVVGKVLPSKPAEISSPVSITEQNFFQIFQLPIAFDIDLSLLKSAYRDLQLLYHPDRQAGASEQDRLNAVQASSIINDAYEVLANPVKRARYMLESAGVNLQEDRSIDPAILIEQMELREKLEDLKGDATSENEASLEAMEDEVAQRLKKVFSSFSEKSGIFFNKEDAATLLGLRQMLAKMLFLNKLLEEIELALSEFD